jgi:hypothetical protein
MCPPTTERSKARFPPKHHVRRGPSIKHFSEVPSKPSMVPSMLVLALFSIVYPELQKRGMITVPSNKQWLEDHVFATGFLTLVGAANIFNHVAGYLQPVPMWSLFVGAFIDTNSSAMYGMVYYIIGYTPNWLIGAWIFQMAIHLYYMSTGLAKPDASAGAFASLIAHMRKLQTNTKNWWNTLFLHFDTLFHFVFLFELLPSTSPPMLLVDVILASCLYSFLYRRVAGDITDDIHGRIRPILFIHQESLELRCPCGVCKNEKPFSVGCGQWFASIDQLYFDCWGIYEDGKKQTKTLMERVRSQERIESTGGNRPISRRSSVHVNY